MNSFITTTMLTGLLSLNLLSPAAAADFSGNLKGVTITDSQAANKPPTAAFTYKQEGETIILDASSSSDPDGSITQYKWDLGNGTMAEGATTSYTAINGTKHQVTLTVIDSNNGVALSQQTITPMPKGINDDFSTDTSANYTVSGGPLLISGGAAHTQAWYQITAIHKTTLTSTANWAQAKILNTADSNDKGAIISGGFRARITGSTVYLEAPSHVPIASYNGGYTGGYYDIKIEVQSNGSLINVYVNQIKVISSIYQTPSTNSCGFYIARTGKAVDITIDNFQCGVL